MAHPPSSETFSISITVGSDHFDITGAVSFEEAVSALKQWFALIGGEETVKRAVADLTTADTRLQQAIDAAPNP